MEQQNETYTVCIDASFQWDGSKAAGGAAVMIDPDETIRGVLLHDLSDLQLPDHFQAEVCCAVLTLECLKAGSINTLFTDSNFVMKGFNSANMISEIIGHEDDPELALYKRLLDGWQKHGQPEVVLTEKAGGKKYRQQEKGMTLADLFAGAVARKNEQRITQLVRENCPGFVSRNITGTTRLLAPRNHNLPLESAAISL